MEGWNAGDDPIEGDGSKKREGMKTSHSVDRCDKRPSNICDRILRTPSNRVLGLLPVHPLQGLLPTAGDPCGLVVFHIPCMQGSRQELEQDVYRNEGYRPHSDGLEGDGQGQECQRGQDGHDQPVDAERPIALFRRIRQGGQYGYGVFSRHAEPSQFHRHILPRPALFHAVVGIPPDGIDEKPQQALILRPF